MIIKKIFLLFFISTIIFSCHRVDKEELERQKKEVIEQQEDIVYMLYPNVKTKLELAVASGSDGSDDSIGSDWIVDSETDEIEFFRFSPKKKEIDKEQQLLEFQKAIDILTKEFPNIDFTIIEEIDKSHTIRINPEKSDPDELSKLFSQQEQDFSLEG